ncbi:MAG TPA: hypothetical protein VNL14_22450 [Candidatus Acidoferrales bacterium]|nr:hypothetical protein [Candidatus Acidoferrales bacterium]
MATKRQLGKVDLDRRAVLVLGLAGASTLVFDRGTSLLAGEAKGTERKVFKERDSIIPGFPKIILRETTFQPGASTKGTMKSAMVCECTQGVLEVKVNDRIVATQMGDIWTCAPGVVEEVANKGSGPAKMRVFELVPA